MDNCNVEVQRRKGEVMIDSILSALIFVTGLLLYFVGRAKKSNKLIGVGIGFIVCLIVVESPDFIQGFIRGFADGYNG